MSQSSGLRICPQEELQEVLHETKLILADFFREKLQEVILYGSYARGDQDEESDVDIMALVNIPREDIPKYRRTVIDLIDDLSLEHEVFLSITLQDIETFRRYKNVIPYYQNVIKDGIRVD